MTMMKILMQLAPTAEFPQGSPAHGYAFFAPLTRSGHIDIAEWDEIQDDCDVVRFWGARPVETGLLRHAENGWHFDYDETHETTFFALDRGSFLAGSYIEMTNLGGASLLFEVVSVTPATGRFHYGELPRCEELVARAA